MLVQYAKPKSQSKAFSERSAVRLSARVRREYASGANFIRTTRGYQWYIVRLFLHGAAGGWPGFGSLMLTKTGQ